MQKETDLGGDLKNDIIEEENLLDQIKKYQTRAVSVTRIL
jgi:hypothetical protein